VIRNYRIKRRGGLGTGTVPSFIHQIFEFHISPKGILQSGKKNISRIQGKCG
jgi:hypothetical protein